MCCFAVSIYNYAYKSEQKWRKTSNNTVEEYTLFRSGDIFFQTSKSSQSKAIQIATKSTYSHCGILFYKQQYPYILEAVEPVKLTPLEQWIDRGVNSEYTVKRLKNWKMQLSEDNLEKLQLEGEKYLHKPYDLTFEWSDEKIYCSELVWKVYKRAIGLEIGSLQRLEDFELNDPTVRKILHKRYGDSIPKKEVVISPVAVFNSDLLIQIYPN